MLGLAISILTFLCFLGGLVFAAGKFKGTMDLFRSATKEGKAQFDQAIEEVRATVEEAAHSAEAKITAVTERTEAVVNRVNDKMDQLEATVSQHQQTLYGVTPGDRQSLVASNAELREFALHEHASVLTQLEFRMSQIEEDRKQATSVNLQMLVLLEKLNARA